MKKKLLVLGVLLAFALGVWLRLYHIEFGLPHSFHADEPEIAELAIKYTYELVAIIKNDDYYKLIPISYVYGTVPTYILTLAVMIFSKTVNLLGNPASKSAIYIFLRSCVAVSSMAIPVISGLLYNKLFKDRFGTLITFILLALNWKLIVHGHYVNADIFLTGFLMGCYFTAYLYHQNPKSVYALILGVCFGLAVGTKVTALLAIPAFLYLFLSKKDYAGFIGFLYSALGIFVITNPFSLLFANDFSFRILTMQMKEAGIVFDSVDTHPLKYVAALGFIVTYPMLFSTLLGIVSALKEKRRVQLHVFLSLQIIIYILFYSLGARKVDRWLLPIIPIVLLYAARGIVMLKTKLNFAAFTGSIVILIGIYLYYPTLTLTQYKKNTPKSAAYIWLRDNIPPEANKLAITEEGLDPLNKLQGILVKRPNVYTSEAAQFDFPPNANGYDYVILSSKPMQNFKRPEVVEKYPLYAKAWQEFEVSIIDGKEFRLIKEFTLPKPNLVNLSDVYIYGR